MIKKSKSSLMDEIERLGQKGHRVCVFYEPLSQIKWTVMVDSVLTTTVQTNKPVKYLRCLYRGDENG